MILKSTPVSRRGLIQLAGLAGLMAVLPVAALADQLPAGDLDFRSVSVDTQGLADRGLSNYAVRIAHEAEPILQKVFADRLTHRADAPRLVLKIDEILLASDGGEAGGFGFGAGASSDSISGAGEVIDARGHVIAMKPITTSAEAYGGNQTNVVQIEDLRTRQLIANLAEWVKRAV